MDSQQKDETGEKRKLDRESEEVNKRAVRNDGIEDSDHHDGDEDEDEEDGADLIAHVQRLQISVTQSGQLQKTNVRYEEEAEETISTFILISEEEAKKWDRESTRTC